MRHSLKIPCNQIYALTGIEKQIDADPILTKSWHSRWQMDVGATSQHTPGCSCLE
jgi:hypothetical protein